MATVPWGRMTVPQWLGGRPWLGALGVRDEIYGLPWDVGDCRGAQNLGFGGDPFGAQARARGEAVSSSSRGPGHWQSGSGGVKGAESSSSSHLQNPSVVSFTERGRGWSQGHLAGVRRLTDNGGGGGPGGAGSPPSQLFPAQTFMGDVPTSCSAPRGQRGSKAADTPRPTPGQAAGPRGAGGALPLLRPCCPSHSSGPANRCGSARMCPHEVLLIPLTSAPGWGTRGRGSRGQRKGAFLENVGERPREAKREPADTPLSPEAARGPAFSPLHPVL